MLRQTEQEFLSNAADTHTHTHTPPAFLAVVIQPPSSLFFSSYLTDRREQVCCVPPALFHTMTCVFSDTMGEQWSANVKECNYVCLKVGLQN